MKILIDKEFVDSLFADASKSPRRRQNYDLRNSNEDTSQRMLNALMPGTDVPIHRHENTTETIVCLTGKLEEIVYDSDVVIGNDGIEAINFKEKYRYLICPTQGVYGMQIPAGVWHTVHVIEPSVIFEAKDGAYIPSK